MTSVRARVLAVLLTALVWSVFPLLGVVAPAAASTDGYAAVPALMSAADPAADRLLALTAVTPPVDGPGVAVTITGTVRAPASAALTAPTVRLVVSTTPIVSRAAVTSWATSTTALTGSEVATVKLPGAVAAGATVPFTLTIPAGRLALSRAFGVVPVAVQLRDTASGTSEVLRTFVGWKRAEEYEPLRLAVVAPVTVTPQAALFSTDAATRIAAWQQQLDPSGRINRILDGTDVTGPAGPVPVTWAVDPALVGGSAGSSSSSGTSGSGGSAATDPLTPVIAPLLTRLATGVASHPLWALPVADPDLAATTATAPNDPTVARLVRESTGLGTALGVPVTTGVAWPTDGSFQADREPGLRAAFQSTGLTAVVGSSSALPVVSGYSGQAPRRTASGIPLLAWDDELTRLAAQTTTPEDGVVTGQRFLAETAALLGESPGVTRSFLVALPRTLDPDPTALRTVLGTVAQVPWVQMVTTSTLQQEAATQDPVASTSAGSWSAGGTPQVDAGRLTRLGAQRQAINEVSSVLGPDGAAYRAPLTTMLDQVPSVRWRQDPSQLAALEQGLAQASTGATSGISVSDQTTNFLADEGTLQITVVNTLSIPVEGVRLVLNPTNPRLRIIDQPQPVTIAPNSRAVVGVKAEALAAGLVPVTATLTTADGTPIGVPGTITVRANPPGYTFYIVGGAVIALVLLLGIVRSIRRPRTPVAVPPAPAGGAAATEESPGVAGLSPEDDQVTAPESESPPADPEEPKQREEAENPADLSAAPDTVRSARTAPGGAVAAPSVRADRPVG